MLLFAFFLILPAEATSTATESSFRAQLAAAPTDGTPTEVILSSSISITSPLTVPAGANVTVRAGGAGVQVTCAYTFLLFPIFSPISFYLKTHIFPFAVSDLGGQCNEDL